MNLLYVVVNKETRDPQFDDGGQLLAFTKVETARLNCLGDDIVEEWEPETVIDLANDHGN